MSPGAAPVTCGSCGAPVEPTMRFCGACGSALPATGERAPAATWPTGEAERRQLTVVFCDLVESTALSERLDPESFREIMREYYAACAGEMVSPRTSATATVTCRTNERMTAI